MSIKPFQSSYERLATIYSGQQGIKLHIGGDSFFYRSDGVMCIADVPQKLIKALKDPALAGLIHECMHARHTDVNKLGSSLSYRRHNVLLNNIEDLRILSLALREYMGFWPMHISGIEWIRDNSLKEWVKETEKLSSTRLGIAIQYEKTGFDSTDLFGKEIKKLVEATRDLWDIKGWKPGKENTQQSIDITQSIIDRIEHMLKKQKEKKEKKREKEKKKKEKSKEEKTSSFPHLGNEVEESDKSDSSNDEEKNELGKQEADREDNNGEGEKNEEEFSQEGEKKDFGDEGRDSEIDDPRDKMLGTGKTEDDLLATMERIVDGEYSPKGKKNGLYDILLGALQTIIRDFFVDNHKHIASPDAMAKDKEEEIGKFVEDNLSLEGKKHLEKQYFLIETKVNDQIKILKAKIMPLLFSQKRTWNLFEQSEGLIDQGNLYKITHGNGRCFKKSVLNRTVNTAVSILIDLSGSMVGPKIDFVRPVATILGDTLYPLKVPFEILGFTTDVSGAIIFARMPYGGMPGFAYNRIEPLYHIIIKGFNQNYQSVRQYIKYLSSIANNCDNESVMWAARRLLQRKEDRKILIVLSDGNPAIRGDSELLRKDLIENVKRITDSGIEILGVGILTDAPEEFYPKFTLIQTIEEIAPKLYSALLSMLQEGFTSSRRL